MNPTEALGWLGRWLTRNDTVDPKDSPPKVTLDAGDISIGAVEVKNDTDDTRAKVKATTPAPSDAGLTVRTLDELGTFGNGTEVVVGVAAGQIVAVNTSRRAVVVQNVGANPARIGKIGVIATTGFLSLAAGEVAVIRDQAALHAIRTGGADTTVLVAEVT